MCHLLVPNTTAMVKLLITSGGKANNSKLINQKLAVDHNSHSNFKKKIQIQLPKLINNTYFRKRFLIPLNSNGNTDLKNPNFL